MKVSFAWIFLSVLFCIVTAQYCPPNENWNVCAPPCPATCSQIIAPLCLEPCFPACVCNLGFIREEFSGYCVSVLECLAGPSIFG